MIEPYTAVGLIPTFWGARHRDDIQKNLDHLSHLTKAATMLSQLEIPVRLIAIPEGALQGFNDEVLDVDHAEYARTCAIDIPGPETEVLGSLAKQYDVFIMAEAKARHADWPNLFFNIGFVIDPDGAVIYSTTSSQRYCLTRGRFHRTTYTIGGLSDTGERSRRSGPLSIQRLGGSVS